MSDTASAAENETTPRDETVRLGAQFIEFEAKRRDVLALLAFAELLRDVPARVSEPLLGDIRYTWWAEALEEIRDQRPVRYHPLSAALEGAVRRYGLDAGALIAAIEAHRGLLDGRLGLREALTVADQGQAAVLAQAAKVLSGASHDLTVAIRFQTLAALKAAGRLKDEEAGVSEGRHLWREARSAIKALPSALLPLALPSVAAGDLWQGRVRGALSLRLGLVWTFLTGRI